MTTAGHTGAVTEQFLHRLGLRLVKLAARTLVRELAQARKRGDLTGATPAMRFLDFTHRLVGGSELADLLAAYPVLARVLGEACRQSLEGHLELLTRLAEDRELIVTELLAGQPLGDLLDAEPSGDPHRGGRSTTTLTFSTGRKLIYKPRPLDLHQHFNEIVDWLNSKTGLAVGTLQVLRRPGYGWLEHVRAEPCGDLTDVRRFYQRYGALLALLFALDGTDMHYDNLIAAGDQPMLVDVETLFHPGVSAAGLRGDPAQAAAADSVLRTALLPLLVTGEHGVVDLSGLGGDAGATMPNSTVDWADAGLDTMHLVRRARTSAGGGNRPHLAGVPLEPRQHENFLLFGFREAFQAIVWHREELLGPFGLLARCAQDQVRLVGRPTHHYLALLDEATHPDALRDAGVRSDLLELLWTNEQVDPRLVPAELVDLWAGDVPVFTSRPDSQDVWSSEGTRIPAVLPVAGLSAVERKIGALTELDQHRQEWLISASLATRPEPVRHGGVTTQPHLGSTEADPEHLLAAASDVADEIMARVYGSPGGPANWLGLEILDDHHWSVRPMGAGLTNGYTGTALFLAEIGVLTGTDKYCELALDAVRPLPALLEVLASDLETARLVGAGLHGLGGIAYGISRLAQLLDNSGLRRQLSATLELSQQLVSEPADFPSYQDGAAGGLAAMLAMNELPAARRLAQEYADQLVRVVAEEAEHPRPPHGFARGYAGLAWALGQYGRPGNKFHAAAQQASTLDCPGDAADAGWCSSGGVGNVLARLSSGLPLDLDTYLTGASQRPTLADLSLCHGELGAIEPVLWLADREHQAAEAVRRRRAGLVLAAVQQYGPRCGTPRAVPSPGLMTGLAGIGHGLLRLGFGHRIPSVLLLQPTTAAAAHHSLGGHRTPSPDRGRP
nr:type 2 lanthipeptide synthetase LanM family protein [Kribbella italica]